MIVSSPNRWRNPSDRWFTRRSRPSVQHGRHVRASHIRPTYGLNMWGVGQPGRLGWVWGRPLSGVFFCPGPIGLSARKFRGKVRGSGRFLNLSRSNSSRSCTLLLFDGLMLSQVYQPRTAMSCIMLLSLSCHVICTAPWTYSCPHY